jgi:putative DNA primase/helicase
MNISAQFINAISKAGITPPMDIIADGNIHRFSYNGKPSNTDGWYVYYNDADSTRGHYGDNHSISETWFSNTSKTLTSAEHAARQAQTKAMQKQREADLLISQAEVASKATAIWDKATPCLEHPYLTKKGVKPYGIRQSGDTLLIPLREDKNIHSLQYIGVAGDKKFLFGGRIKGCYFAIGKPDSIIYIAEGYATAASIHAATGCAVVVAFNAGNLLEVAKTIRTKYPKITLVICADDDLSGVGISKANEAAKLVGASVVMPLFGADRPDKATDFNDLHQSQGLDALTQQLDAHNSATSDLNVVVDTMSSAINVSLMCASNITPEPIRWLWNGWLAKGKLHIFAGMAGTGKTTIAIALAATITTGGRFPDGSRCPVGSVLIWSGEDSPADTLVPRLMAAGADLSKVHFVGETTANYELRSFDPATDMQPLMIKAASITDLALLIIDPIVNAVAGDSHKNGEVRRALQPVVEFGEKLNCAVLGITHFSKGGQGKDPLERVTGSLAFGALARIVLATAKIVDGDKTKRIVCRAKSNIGIDTGGFEYDLQEKEVDAGIFSSYVLWGEAVEGSAIELLAEPDNRETGENGSALDEAIEFLQDLLADGELSQKQIEIDAKGAGLSMATIKRAKKCLNIRSKKSLLDKGWYWLLPSKGITEDQGDQEAHINNVNPLSPLPKIDPISHQNCNIDRNNQIATF